MRPSGCDNRPGSHSSAGQAGVLIAVRKQLVVIGVRGRQDDIRKRLAVLNASLVQAKHDDDFERCTCIAMLSAATH